MADKIIKLKIDVTKIDKSKLFAGEKGTYLDCTLLYKETKDQYGNNGMIVQDVSKADREAGIKGNILGNAKVPGQPASQPAQNNSSFDDQDLPF